MENLPNEVWKPIEEAKGKYMISSMGRVKNTATGKILKPQKTYKMTKNKGYLYPAVRLYIYPHEKRTKTFFIHRLVAKYFVDNPNGYKIVNHKDGNIRNNDASNLEWCTIQYNLKHAVEHGLRAKANHVRKVVVSDNNGDVMVLESIMSTAKCFRKSDSLKSVYTKIHNCCNGLNKGYRGLKFSYFKVNQ